MCSFTDPVPTGLSDFQVMVTATCAVGTNGMTAGADGKPATATTRVTCASGAAMLLRDAVQEAATEQSDFRAQESAVAAAVRQGLAAAALDRREVNDPERPIPRCDHAATPTFARVTLARAVLQEGLRTPLRAGLGRISSRRDSLTCGVSHVCVVVSCSCTAA